MSSVGVLEDNFEVLGLGLEGRVLGLEACVLDSITAATEQIDISKTHTETIILKIFSILILYTYRNDHVKKLTETVIEISLKTDTEIIWLRLSQMSTSMSA